MLMRTWLHKAGLVAVTVSLGAMMPLMSNAVDFEAQEIEQSEYIAISSPFGKESFGLIILQQLPKGKTCWQETGSNPTTVDPLLLQFDFKGSCRRFTDSNGYSIRVAGQDLGLKYSLRIVRFEGELFLLGVPAIGTQGLPVLFVGRTNGDTTSFAKFNLNPGWRLARRAFQGKFVGHIYFLNDMPLEELAKLPDPTEPKEQQASPVTTPPEPPATITQPGATPSLETTPAQTDPGASPDGLPAISPPGTSTIESVPTIPTPLSVPTAPASVNPASPIEPGQAPAPVNQ